MFDNNKEKGNVKIQLSRSVHWTMRPHIVLIFLCCAVTICWHPEMYCSEGTEDRVQGKSLLYSLLC